MAKSGVYGVGTALAICASVALVGCYPSWQLSVGQPHRDVNLRGAGQYLGPPLLNLDSIAPNMVGVPTKTSAWEVIPNATDPVKGQVVFSDPVLGLKLDPNSPATPMVRGDGTISAVATVLSNQADVKVSVMVNTNPPPTGSFSQQGPMLHWNGANSYSTCFVNFAAGESHIWAARNEIQYEALGLNKIAVFDNKKAYRIEYTVIGAKYRCRVFDGAAQVADTGEVSDPKSPAQGNSGYMVQVALAGLDKPIQGSFSELSAQGLSAVGSVGK